MYLDEFVANLSSDERREFDEQTARLRKEHGESLRLARAAARIEGASTSAEPKA